VATEYGTFHESGALAEYQMETGNTVDQVGFVEYQDWLGASPDGLVGVLGLVEIKCPFGQRDKNPPQFKSIDDQPHYYAQMQWEMLCTGWPAIWFYQWAPHDAKLELVERDQSWLDENLPILRQFYAFYLSELDNPEHLEPKRIEVNTEETRLLFDELDQLKEAIDNATERKKEVEASLVKAAGERDAICWGRKITKVDKEGAISYAKAVKELCPDADLEKWRGKPSSYWKIT
jgi:hypothetical protein